MRILDYIKTRIFRSGDVLSWGRAPFVYGAFETCRYKFAQAIWYNICDILTDIIEDVEITDKTNSQPFTPMGDKFAAFKAFVYSWGKTILQRLYDEGYVVVAYDRIYLRFWILDSSEYVKVTTDGVTTIKPKDETLQVYVMRSASWTMYEKSDRRICKAFLDYIDDTLNGSATVSKRLGAVVVATPKNLNQAPTAVVLKDNEKKDLEKQMRDDYGALDRQSNIMLLPREMNFQVINLAGLDLRMTEKVKTAILAIVDRIKIPANQVAIIDAQSNKSLANGGEIREGDKLKYKSFRRLFERTIVEMATYYGLRIDYKINGEPIGESSEVTV